MSEKPKIIVEVIIIGCVLGVAGLIILVGIPQVALMWVKERVFQW